MTTIGATVVFDDVRKTYGDVVAVDAFSLSIEPGEFVTFLGPSGSGKTTVLNMLAGFVDASGGDIEVDGRSILSVPTEKRNVGMVFQHYSLFPHMSVVDNVAFPLRMRGVGKRPARERAVAALATVQLEAMAGRMPDQLSGGQKQRVALARAVVFEPPVLLMDEPLGALDLKLREAMQVELKRFHETVGCTVIFVTHDQTEALTLSDRIAVMNEGRIVQVDTPGAIYDRPKTRFVAEFIGQTNLFALERTDGTSLRVAEIDADLPLPEAAAPTDGALFASVRPERIRRGANGAASEIGFDAEIDEVLFLGNEIQYGAQTSAGRNLYFREQRGAGSDLLKRGERVRLGFDRADAVPVVDDMATEA